MGRKSIACTTHAACFDAPIFLRLRSGSERADSRAGELLLLLPARSSRDSRHRDLKLRRDEHAEIVTDGDFTPRHRYAINKETMKKGKGIKRRERRRRRRRRYRPREPEKRGHACMHVCTHALDYAYSVSRTRDRAYSRDRTGACVASLARR